MGELKYKERKRPYKKNPNAWKEKAQTLMEWTSDKPQSVIYKIEKFKETKK